MLLWASALTACASPRPVAMAAQLGVPVRSEMLSARTMHVFPDGRGLPSGSGTVQQGADLFAQHCAACHGRDGRGGVAEELTGATRPLDSPDADRTIGSYWPYATTLFDYIRRTKPMTAPGTLNADEVYALSAWLLHKNGVIGVDTPMTAQSMPAVRMPNRNGFIRVEAPENRR